METVTAPMTINGRAVTSPSSFDVVDPATEAPWASAPECTPGQLDEAFASALRAQKDWSADELARRSAISGMLDVLTANADELGYLLTMEQGKPLAGAGLEISAAAARVAHARDLVIPDEEHRHSTRPMTSTVRRRPLGVVAAITPWNFPITLAMYKLPLALLAGNTVVLKPSPYTPIATLRLGQLLADVFPAGVLNVVSGGDDLGSRMTSHPIPRKVSFTGSVATGKKVAISAAADLKRTTLELGGNDPAIILDDADIAACADDVFWRAFYNNGQVCGCIKRVYVPAALRDPLADRLVELASGVRVGNGLDPDSVLGPINNRMQFDRVRELLAAGIHDGGIVRSGGTTVGDKGYFLTPVIMTDVAAGSRIVVEEQFGPLLPVVTYDDIDELIGEVNSSMMGLGASVWSADQARARAIAEQLDAGNVWINTHAFTDPGVPFGGAKWSGVGIEGGLEGYYANTQIQVIHESDPA